mgnify:FL=1|jgi:hypothetical protein|nr:MAG TPA: hypothetical protein [Crassvirales sp.]
MVKTTSRWELQVIFFNNGGWTPVLIDITIESVGQLVFQYVEDVPDIVIS